MEMDEKIELKLQTENGNDLSIVLKIDQVVFTHSLEAIHQVVLVEIMVQ